MDAFEYKLSRDDAVWAQLEGHEPEAVEAGDVEARFAADWKTGHSVQRPANARHAAAQSAQPQPPPPPFEAREQQQS